MDSAGCFESIQACVNEVAAVEGACETLRSWVVFVWQVLCTWQFAAVLLIGCLIN